MKKDKKITTKPAEKKEKINRKVAAKKAIGTYLEKRNNKIFIGNWKSHKDYKEIQEYASEFNSLLRSDSVLKNLNFVIGIAPSMIGLIPVCGLMGKYIAPVAQHVIPYSGGTYTGQVFYEHVHQYNVNYAFVGHSETRKFFNLSDTFCRDCIRALIKSNMRPILCIGEDKEQYDARHSKKVVMLQLMNCLKQLNEIEVRQAIIAYEPVWAMGQQVAAHEWITDMTKHIRKCIAELFDAKTAKEVHILYGGSVKPENAPDILRIPGVDGVIVGGSSLKPNRFYDVICSAPEYAYANAVLYPPKKNKKKSK